MTGAYVHDADGVYTQINAKAVVLATGDWGNNQDMRDYFVPWANEFMSFYHHQWTPPAMSATPATGISWDFGPARIWSSGPTRR